jgi:hypothetical protein
MINEQDVRDAIEKLNKYRVPAIRIEMSPEDFYDLRHKVVPPLPESEAKRMFGMPVFVKQELPPGCFRVCSDKEESNGDL